VPKDSPDDGLKVLRENRLLDDQAAPEARRAGPPNVSPARKGWDSDRTIDRALEARHQKPMIAIAILRHEYRAYRAPMRWASVLYRQKDQKRSNFIEFYKNRGYS
jgi:hypothetical protein